MRSRGVRTIAVALFALAFAVLPTVAGAQQATPIPDAATSQAAVPDPVLWPEGPRLTGTTAKPNVAARAPSDCSATANNPHNSGGANGIIFKIRFGCTVGGGATFNSWIGTLYKCTSKPDATKAEATWTSSSGCRAWRQNSSTDDQGAVSVASGSSKTRYVPKVGQSGGAPDGSWWIACVRGYYSTGTAFADASQAVQL